MVDDILSTVEWHACHYWDIRKAVSEKRVDMMRRKPKVGGVQEGRLSDPTASAAIANMTPIPSVVIKGVGRVEEPEAWVKAIENGVDACREEVQKVARESMFNNRRYSYSRLGIDRRTYYKRKAEALTAIAMAAVAMKLVIAPGGEPDGKH